MPAMHRRFPWHTANASFFLRSPETYRVCSKNWISAIDVSLEPRLLPFKMSQLTPLTLYAVSGDHRYHSRSSSGRLGS